MIHITEEQVREALPMTKAVELVEGCFRRLDGGRAVNHPRRRLFLENGAVLQYMAAADEEGEYMGAKVYATHPRAGARFVVLLFDATSAALLATIDANVLGQIRTGAASAVATRHMARPEATRLGIIGSGWQAETQLEAVAAARTLSVVKVYSRSSEKRSRFAQRMGKRLALPIEAVDTAEEAVADADVVVTITKAREPVLEGRWLAPGCHVNAAGSNHAKRREIDAATLERAAVIAVDSLEQAKVEAGDLIQAAKEGRLDWNRVRELPAIVAARQAGRNSPEDVTLFESQGLAAEDIAVAGHVFRQVSRPV